MSSKIGLIVLGVALILAMLVSCKATKKNTSEATKPTNTNTNSANNAPKPSEIVAPPKPMSEVNPNVTIVIGNKGGFTGATNKYEVAANGTVTNIRTKALEEKTVVKQLSTEQVYRLQQKALALNLDELDFQHPNNMTFFISYINSSTGANNTVEWGDPNFPVEPAIKALYSQYVNLFMSEDK